MVLRREFLQPPAMSDDDQFVAGLRRIFAENPHLKPARVSTDAGLDNSTIRKIFAGQSGSPKFENAEKIARALNMTVLQILEAGGGPSRPTVAIAGKVGAGARVPVFDAYEKGDGPQVELPPQIKSPHGIVAVEIEGDSMEPIYREGDILFYRREALGVPTEAIGHICVCECEDGLGWVKQVKLGTEPGLFHLIAVNPAADTQHDMRLKWAAPVRFHLPAQDTRKVGTASGKARST